MYIASLSLSLAPFYFSPVVQTALVEHFYRREGVCARARLCVRVNIQEIFKFSLHPCVCAYVCVCLCARACVCVCVRVFVCVTVSVLLRAREHVSDL